MLTAMDPNDVERFTRHLRAKGHRVAIGSTVVPDDWSPGPELMQKLHPERQHRSNDNAFQTWCDELKERT